MTIPQALTLAIGRHRAGRLADAEALYRQILAAQPDHVPALHLLGVIAHQVGRHDAAVELIRQSIALHPNDSAAHCNLGEACRALGRFDEAAAAYRRAIALKPGFPEPHNNLGIVFKERGQLDESVAAYRRAIELKPDYLEAHNNLGVALKDAGQLGEAVIVYRRALELKPDYAEALSNLGNALRELMQFDEAVAALRRAIALQPDFAEAHNNLGNTLRDRGELGEAAAAFRRALELKPNVPEVHNNLGVFLASQNRLDEAVAAYDRALQLKPDYPEAANNLGAALAGRGQLDEAIAIYRRALELKPNFSGAWNNLGNALKGRCELTEAIAAYRRALQIKPDYVEAHCNLIFALHFDPRQDARSISDEHRRWDSQFGEPLRRFVQPHANDPATAGRLRVGYVSPDFRDHVVARFALPLFERHDRERFEILAYSGVVWPDATTERFRGLAGKWRNTAGVSDVRLAEMIREDEVDILVDLAMHTQGNRLLVFARQPAPVQVTWLAYPGGPGLRSIGYRLTDAHMDPPGAESAGFAEEPVRLPDSWCCYDPVDESPEVNALPALSAQGLSFGSLNTFAKVNEEVLALWARILEEAKKSRLLMVCPEGQTRERVRSFFAARGIAADRVEMVGLAPRSEYLKIYHQIDLCLDPFPCNGMTTTCDALWMGAPVLTLPGDLPVSRAGLSLLSSVGLADFAASSHEDYVRIAIESAGNLPRLADLRANLRARMRASPLMDAPRFARNVEAAYETMWERWRGGPGSRGNST